MTSLPLRWLSKGLSLANTWGEPSAGHALVHPVDIVVQVAGGSAHHADTGSCAQRVQVAAVVIPHGVPILHDGCAAG